VALKLKLYAVEFAYRSATQLKMALFLKSKKVNNLIKLPF
jgi:hypothetical protein